mgnify:CR=1 FL=1
MQRLLDDYSGLPLWLQSLIALCALAVAALTVNWLLKKVLLRIAAPYLDARSDTVDRSAAWLTTVIPLLLVSRGIGLVPHLPEEVVQLLSRNRWGVLNDEIHQLRQCCEKHWF